MLRGFHLQPHTAFGRQSVFGYCTGGARFHAEGAIAAFALPSVQRGKDGQQFGKCFGRNFPNRKRKKNDPRSEFGQCNQ